MYWLRAAALDSPRTTKKGWRLSPHRILDISLFSMAVCCNRSHWHLVAHTSNCVLLSAQARNLRQAGDRSANGCHRDKGAGMVSSTRHRQVAVRWRDGDAEQRRGKGLVSPNLVTVRVHRHRDQFNTPIRPIAQANSENCGNHLLEDAVLLARIQDG